MMLERVCAHIHNYFTGGDDIHAGEFTIENESLTLPFLLDGQYFRIVGSALNDGVYQYPADTLADETFTGEVWAMKPPRTVLKLVEEIKQWQDKYGAVMAGPYQSENVIGVYSYAKASGEGGGASADAWAEVFRGRLNAWRKLR